MEDLVIFLSMLTVISAGVIVEKYTGAAEIVPI